MIKSKGYAGFNSDTPLKLHHFERREVGDFDILIKIKYCGVCHSDIHTVRNEWGGAKYPLVPGHEIIGVVERIGPQVTNHQVGDTVGVGCMVNSCGHCHECALHMEQFCDEGATFTYNTVEADGETTKGGYSDNIVVHEQFVLSVPAHLNLAQAAPLLCAGITTYSPLKHWNIKAGDKVGIIGLGGLGHMAVKFAHAFGAHVVVFTTSEKKISDALSMGAHDVVLSTNRQEMLKHSNSFDFILDTVSAPHDVNAYMALLKHEKTLCMVGISPTPHQIASSSLFMGRKNLSGSLIGGIAETQEMLDFCGQHQITCTIEMISIKDINEAYTRMLKSDVKYRFVIDMASLNHMP
jgi:uncharacterized zinc-type alcohol dehydrogenase-like protein